MKKTKYSLSEIQSNLYSAVISDALDALGYRNQSPRIPLKALTGIPKLVGRCKTTLWTDMFHEDPAPYELELKAVDECKKGEVIIAAASGSVRSGIWGELLSTAARNSGCVGAIVHGAVRDVAKMREMKFPVFGSATSLYDSLNRQRVIDLDVPVEIDKVIIEPGALVFCDEDGMVVIPLEVEEAAIKNAMEKVNAENITREEIKKGMKATDVYKKYGIL
ncbi:MAG: RraA family protein [Saprospiraceae bacterium]|nr:RraA family protein [Saprospiraceae bacterium]